MGWSELNSEQIRQVLPIVMQMKYQQPDYEQILAYGAELYRALSGEQWALSLQQAEGESLNLTKEDESELVAWVIDHAWLWTQRIEEKPFVFIHPTGDDRLFLPKIGFADTSAVELALSNLFYTRFATAETVEEQDNLYQLIAVICRPAKMEGGKTVRVPLDLEKASERVEAIKELPIGEVLAILQYWEGMNERFMQNYSELFPENNDGTPSLFEAGEGWIAMLEDVARDGVYGDMEKVEKQNCHNIWMYLKHQRIIENERNRKAAKK